MRQFLPNIFKTQNKFSQNLMFRPQNYFSDKQKRELPKFMTISDQAALRLKELMDLKQDNDIMGVKVGVKQRGCSGLTYTMNYVKKGETNKFDELIKEKGVCVVIDQKALMALLGTEMDYVDEDLRSEFVFNNPNSKGTCGCGESFYI